MRIEEIRNEVELVGQKEAAEVAKREQELELAHLGPRNLDDRPRDTGSS